MNAIVVFITLANRDEAIRVAHLLIAEKLAACVQVLPEITSIYRWQGKVSQETEVLLLVKTVKENFEELERVVQANHSYEVPEIVAAPASQISAPYLNWLQENARQ